MAIRAGHRLCRDAPPRLSIAWNESLAKKAPREADHRMTVLNIVLNEAAKRGDIRENPIKGFDRAHKADRADLIWTANHITAFMKNAPLELKQALILALHTGQRYGDLIRLQWSSYNGKEIALRQSKRGVHVRIPATACLKAMLDSMPQHGPYILTRSNCAPWFTERNDKHLSKMWRAHARSAGINDVVFHDLRGTTVTLLNEAGASIQQIAAITGHTMRSAATILERYSARTPELARAAIAAFEASPTSDFANGLPTSI